MTTQTILATPAPTIKLCAILYTYKVDQTVIKSAQVNAATPRIDLASTKLCEPINYKGITAYGEHT